MAETKYYGTGRRKSAVARVYVKAGKGKILINGHDVNEYMPFPTLVLNLKQPLALVNGEDRYDVEANVQGGGFTGQAEAIRLGIARALLEAGEERSTLKVAGMLTRNARSKERKKYGLKGARRAPQFSKR
ncbi:MAG: 30S ribosomal protein S9 [Firmicutes bacterium]|uniref:Small ribosomal subunit protein uS9 n=1 Tax=Candidatus Alloenteromonas pullistercoris TaxID=2840785 RepID=A0A9D9GW30_9FIRM|nr:30S ribosomal protein S9 [Candidatus Enteromonas pullistercoris]